MATAANQVLDIRTLDGTVYEDAEVLRIGPDGIDIGYVKPDGSYAMKGLRFLNLPVDLQKRFGYDPAKAAEFEAKVRAQAKAADLEQTAEREAQQLARIRRELEKKFKRIV